MKAKKKPKLAFDPWAPEFQEIRNVLCKIANMGQGIKPEIIDWANIGKNATYLAREYFKPKCSACGQAVQATQDDS